MIHEPIIYFAFYWYAILDEPHTKDRFTSWYDLRSSIFFSLVLRSVRLKFFHGHFALFEWSKRYRYLIKSATIDRFTNRQHVTVCKVTESNWSNISFMAQSPLGVRISKLKLLNKFKLTHYLSISCHAIDCIWTNGRREAGKKFSHFSKSKVKSDE